MCSHLYVESNVQDKLINKIKTEAWIRGTDRSQGEMGDWKRLGKEHICMTHRHRQQCEDCLRWGAGWR